MTVREQEPDPFSPVELLRNGWLRPSMPPGWLANMTIGLHDVPNDELVAALLHLQRTSEWRPNSPAVVRKAVVMLRGVFPSEAEAGRQGQEYARKIRKIRDSGPQPRYPVVHPAVADAVDAAGAEHEASFIKAYREAIDRRLTQIIGDSLTRPVVFHPAEIPGADRQPPDYTWERGGWRTPNGELVHADRGDQIAIDPGPQQAALTT